MVSKNTIVFKNIIISKNTNRVMFKHMCRGCNMSIEFEIVECVSVLSFKSLSNFFQLFHDSARMRQGSQCPF